MTTSHRIRLASFMKGNQNKAFVETIGQSMANWICRKK